MPRLRSKLALAVAGVLAVPLVASAEPVTYTGDFHPSNGSGVTGTTQLTLDGTTLTVQINATGLAPDQPHPAHVHGFPDGRESVCPPEVLTPSIDLNANGILDVPEAEALVGPPILPLTVDDNDDATTGEAEPHPTAPGGVINYTRTFENVDLAMLGQLEQRAVELHGLMLGETYDPLLPIACAELALLDTGGGGGGGGGTVIPLPAGVWSGLVLLGALAGKAKLRRRGAIV
ncbi:MAG TPA: hypothetical protein VER17_04295 [Tepidisphaeraceae bacterium]|nr:hypothetical protein [Tepidisphaeraceae bacterium]